MPKEQEKGGNANVIIRQKVFWFILCFIRRLD